MFNRYVIRGECGFEGAHSVPFGPQPEEVAGLSPFSSSTPGGRLRAGDLPGRFGISLRGVYPTQDCVHAPACPRHILGSRRLDSRPLGPGIFLSAARCTFSSRRRGEILCFRRDLAFSSLALPAGLLAPRASLGAGLFRLGLYAQWAKQSGSQTAWHTRH